MKKKLSVLFAIFFAFCLIGCSNPSGSDPIDNLSEFDLSGTWDFKATMVDCNEYYTSTSYFIGYQELTDTYFRQYATVGSKDTITYTDVDKYNSYKEEFEGSDDEDMTSYDAKFDDEKLVVELTCKSNYKIVDGDFDEEYTKQDFINEVLSDFDSSQMTLKTNSNRTVLEISYSSEDGSTFSCIFTKR